MEQLHVHPDIKKAETLPASFYQSPNWFEQVKEKIFAHSWHYLADASALRKPGFVAPFTLLPGVIDEPLVVTKDKNGDINAMSNVCTHRGMLVAREAGEARNLRCGYHGRVFRLDGSFKSMPEFSDVENFPRPCDNLHRVGVEEWLGLLFTSLEPKVPFAEMVKPMVDRLGWMPFDSLEFQEEGTQDFAVKSNWALYCDNYLEGFHVPFVHPALNEAIDFGQYEYETYDYCNLQIGIAEEGEPYFDLPPDSPDYGRNIYAYYYFLFPNMMFNFYPWGLSLNIIEPQDHETTLVRFRTYRFKDQPFNRTDNNLEKTEYEDEDVVEGVQLGIQSRFYKSGRFSPKMEPCVHHFHRLIADWMNAEE